MVKAWDAGSPRAIDESLLLAAVQGCLRAAIVTAPWPHALTAVAENVLSEPRRVLGGCLTPWAALPLYCCAAVCGGDDWQCAVPVAVGAELYSTALDLLDDVEDGDASPAVERYGVPIVINTATALLALAHTALQPANSGSPETAPFRRAQDALWEGLAVATGGQYLDLAAAGATPLTVEACLDIALRKGGALVEACCRAGATLRTDNSALVDLFGVFGRSVGLYGQLDNDMHDAVCPDSKSDVMLRKQTVPIVMARASSEHGPLSEAVWQGGIQLAYALVHAERIRAQEALDFVAVACPDPAFARSALERFLVPSKAPGAQS